VAQEIREFAVMVPHGTLPGAPLTVDISFPERVVAAVSYRVPPGPSGVMGWQLTSAGAPVIPIQRGAYIVTDNQSATWQLSGYLDSGNWQVTAYNTGVYDHTVYFTFELDLPGAGAAPTPPPPVLGTGVIGTTGAVVPITPAPPPVSPPSSPPGGDTAAVVTAVLAAAVASMRAAAAGTVAS